MRRRQRFAPLKSIKNSVTFTGSVGTSTANQIVITAVANPSNTASDEVENGCKIDAIWLSLDFCGLAATGVQQTIGVYLFKNAGANLTPPTPFAVGNSNEKRFVIKEWSAMTMRNQDGNPPYHWEGWIKVPKVHQRMATDDVWQLVNIADSAAGHISMHLVYKWKT